MSILQRIARKVCGHDRDAELVVERFVNRCTKDDVGLGVGNIGDALRDGVDVLQRHAIATCGAVVHAEQPSPRAVSDGSASQIAWKGACVQAVTRS